jgi:orotate phosphoribosyltransferase
MALKPWIIKSLKAYNSPEVVKGRGFISCHGVISENLCSVTNLFYEEINKTPFCNFGYVGGLENGAILIAQGLHEYIINSDYDSSYYPFYVRKTEKGTTSIECGFESKAEPSKAEPSKDIPVIIVDDVLTTGYSIARAALAIEREWGYKPTLAVVLVDNEMGGKEFLLNKHGIECRSIFTRKEILG